MLANVAITFNSIYLLWAVAIGAHLTYAAVTHYHKLGELRQYLKKYNDAADKHNAESKWNHESHRKVDSHEFALPAVVTLFCGLELKILEIVIYSIAKLFGTLMLLDSFTPWELEWHESPADSDLVARRLTLFVKGRE